MAKRVPPNKGIIEFPAIFHMRITKKMLAWIKRRGGATYIRNLVTLDKKGQRKLPFAPS